MVENVRPLVRAFAPLTLVMMAVCQVEQVKTAVMEKGACNPRPLCETRAEASTASAGIPHPVFRVRAPPRPLAPR